MALTEQTIPVRLAGGVDTKSDPKTVPTTSLLVAENLVFAQGGSLAKRCGYDLLSKDVDGRAEPYAAPRALAARDDELILFAGGRAYSRRPSSESWSDVGPVASLTSTERPVVKTGTHQTDADCWASGGIVVSAWEDSRGGVWWAALEEATDRVLRAAEQLDAQGVAPRVVAAGGRFHVYWLRPAAGEIYVAVMNPASYLSPPAVSLLADGVDVAKPGYDVAATARPGAPALTAWPVAGGDQVRLSYVDGSGVLGSPVTGHPTGVTMSIPGLDGAPVGVDWRDGWVAVCAPVGADLVVMTRQDIDLAITVVDVVIPDMVDGVALRCSCAFVDPPADQLFSIWSAVECDAPRPQDHQVTFARVLWDGDDPRLDYAFPLGVQSDPRQLRGHGLLSRVHAVGADAHVVVGHQVPFFPYAAVVRLDDYLSFSAVGQLLVGVFSGLRSRRVVASVAAASDDPAARLWGGCYREQTLADAEGAQFTETGIRLCRVNHDDEDALQSARLGADLVIAGSSPQRYDGGGVAELNFRTAPDGEIDVVQGTGGSLEPGKTYSWQFCYEEVDAAGERHQGPMSVPVVVTMDPGKTSVTFQVPTYRLTGKRRAWLAAWRSEGDDETSDPRYFRVTSLNPLATGPNGFVLNTIGADYVAFTDGISDLDLLLREPAYTNGGVLSNDPAPVGSLVAGGKGRLFFSSAADQDTVHYTQQRRVGYGPELSTGLSIQLDPEGGPVTAVAVLDDMVVVFKRGQTYAFGGPGPLPNPDAAPQVGFDSPQLVTSDVGCVAPRSIAVTPIGIVFRSARGYHLLDRSRQVRYVGADVERWNDLTVAGAVALPNRTSILILHVDGPALHYDYYFGKWSWFTNHEALDAVVAGEQYYFLRADVVGQVARENRSSYLDGNREVRFYLETSWIKFLPYVQGWQKLWHALVVGEYVSPHLLRMRVAIDYEKGWGAPYDLDPQANRDPANYGDGPYGDGPYGGDADTLYQERVHVSEQCMAAKFSLEDLPYGEAPLGGSVVLTELLLTGGAVRASERPRASRSH